MIKRTSTDAIFSDCIREAYDYRCQYPGCEMHWPERKGLDAHLSHFISRSFSSVRHFPDNALLLCAAHHDLVGKDPAEHYRLILGHLGEVRLEELRRRKHQVMRYRNQDKAAMRKHYRAELARIRALRMAGTVGPVEVVSYD